MHSVLTAAHEAAPAASRPTASAHLGVDANPQLGSFGFCGVALYIADAMAPQAKPKEVKQLQRWLSQAHDIYQRHARAEGVMVKRGTKSQRRVLTAEQTKKLRQELTNDDDIIDLAQGLSTPLEAANAALLAAYDVEQSPPRCVRWSLVWCKRSSPRR